MNAFYIVICEEQTDGLTRFVRYQSQEAAQAEARHLAGRFPDQCFYTCKAMSVSIAPGLAIETYDLRAPLRECV